MNAVEKINQELKGISDKLTHCPFCAGKAFMDWTTIFDPTEPYSIETAKKTYWGQCEKCDTRCGCVGYPTPEKALEMWNMRSDVYSPVKPEDIDCGKYFIRKDSMRANLLKFVTVTPDGRVTVYSRSDETGTVEDYVLRGHTFFRIPEVPQLEVAE